MERGEVNMLQLPKDWVNVLKDEIHKPYFLQLTQFLNEEYKTHTIYPSYNNIFQAFNCTPFNEVKVVILGQDPYHGEHQAHGLSFSVQNGVKIPPSLRNIYKELEDDLKVAAPLHGDLTNWAKQGVLLLNTVLTVRAGQANSHKGRGWEQFTDSVIQKLAERKEPIIFVLWGSPAQKKASMIKKYSQHRIIIAPHPSPLSAYRGFFGSKPFSTINQILGKEAIDWTNL